MTAPARQWHSMRGLLSREGPMQAAWFDPEVDALEWLQEESRVLVVGAGGLGCELLKNLALSGFRDVHVIDLDTIDISNLNRQFLFRKRHVGRYKAEVAAEVIRAKFPRCKVTPHTCRIQEFAPSWYTRFDVVIAGLDNVEARRWLNRTLHSIVRFDADCDVDITSVVPLIDGGTEGLKGQARLFLPRLTSCYECSVSSMPQVAHFHQCTIASTPRIPEHCIQYVKELLWPRLVAFRSVDDYELDDGEAPDAAMDGEDAPAAAPAAPAKDGGVPLDKDNAEHMSWIFRRAEERAAQFGIEGVTYKLTMQVVKNIIPAIASTNAVIAAACVNEAVKFGARCSQQLDNFMFFNGQRMEGCALHQYGRLPDCAVCRPPKVWAVDPASTLADLRARCQAELGIAEPDLGTDKGVLFMGKFRDQWEANLARPLRDLLADNDAVSVTGAGKREEKVIVVFPGDDEDDDDDDE